MLNPQAPEFKPTQAQLAVQEKQNAAKQSRDPQRTRRQQQRNRKGSKQQQNAWWWTQMQIAYWQQLQQSMFFAPVPAQDEEEEEEEFDREISEEHLQEIVDTDKWVETMLQIEDEEREHLTAMALELAPAVGWHMDHDLELVPAEEKDGGLTVVAKPKPKAPSVKGGAKQQASKQRRTNKGANKATTR